MDVVWVPAATISPRGSVEFTAKGATAIEAVFRALDKDASGGLNFDEFRSYVEHEGESLTLEDFQTLPLDLTDDGEVSLAGFQDVYRAAMEADFAQGEERLHSDLARFNLGKILKARNVAAMLMSGKGPSGAPESQDPTTGPRAKRKQRAQTSAAPSLPQDHSKQESSSESIVVDLISPRHAKRTKNEALEEEDDDASSEAAPKPVHPFFTKQNTFKSKDKPVYKALPKEEPVDEVRVHPNEVDAKKIHPFFLQRPRTSSITQQQHSFNSDEEEACSPRRESSFSRLLKNIKSGDEFPGMLPQLGAPSSKSSSSNAKSMQGIVDLLAVEGAHSDQCFRLEGDAFERILQRVESVPRSDTVEITDSPIAKVRQVAEKEIAPAFLDLSVGDDAEHVDLTQAVIQPARPSKSRRVVDDEPDAPMDLSFQEDEKQQAWPQKFAPKRVHEIAGNEEAVSKLRVWLETMLMDRSRTDSEGDDEEFLEDEDEDDPSTQRNCKAVILFGPSGSGKTSAVYAVADELAYVDINQRRTVLTRYAAFEYLK
jgi:hypothetical protein